MAEITSKRLLVVALIASIACCVGCGGGGGGGSAPSGGAPSTGGAAGTPVTPPPATLGLTADSPSLTGKIGQEISLPVTITGSGTITTASFEVQFNDGVFEPTGTRGDASGQSAALTEITTGTAGRYKWVDSHTIRVVFAAADGVASGTVLVNVPVKVKSQTAAGVTIQSVSLNQ